MSFLEMNGGKGKTGWRERKKPQDKEEREGEEGTAVTKSEHGTEMAKIVIW